jgi:4a-hydroxytetrahydrobiopterin dehydratase
MPRTPRLTESQLAAELPALAGWERRGDELHKTYRLATFADAIAFVNRVAGIAERHDHHPDILVQYTRVTLTLSTHDSGGLTDLDLRLAREIDG